MADLLTAVSTRKTVKNEPPVQEFKTLQVHQGSIDSAATALEALKAQPDRQTVDDVLAFLTSGDRSLILPDPLSASIAYQLVSDTIPNYWATLRNSPTAKSLSKVLRNPTGIGHIITRLRSLIASSRGKQTPGQPQNLTEHIKELLEVVSRTLHDEKSSSLLLRGILKYGKNDVQKKLLWKEYLGQVVSGKLTSVVAEAEDILKSKSVSIPITWLSDGGSFATWLGRNLVVLLEEAEVDQNYALYVVEYSSKVLSLGYTGEGPRARISITY